MNNLAGIVELQEQLAADTKGELRKNIVTRLQKLADELRMKLRGLHTRQTYGEIEAAMQAVSGAIRVLQVDPKK